MKLNENIEEIADKLNLDYKVIDNRIVMPCPVHGGDNAEAFCLYLDGIKQKGNWVCWTHGCEKKHGQDLLGLIRGLTGLGFMESVNYALDLLNLEVGDIQIIETPQSIHKINQITETILRERRLANYNISREDVLKSLNIPSPYFIERGFSSEVLKLFDVGDCHIAGKKMYNRAVVPVYDEFFKFVGCVGRHIGGGDYRKWINSDDFKRSYLYGIHITKEHIIRARAIVLVEGQGDVWRLYENRIKNGAGIFGTALVDDQLMYLESLPIETIIVLTDMDDAGREAANQIKKVCGRRFNYIVPEYPTKDVGELTDEQFNTIIKPAIKGYF